MPASRGFHQSFIHAGSLFLAGGIRRDSTSDAFTLLKDVVRLHVGVDGTEGHLNDWVSAGELPVHRQIASATVLEERVFFVGGMDENNLMVGSVLCASIEDNTLVEVELLADRLSPRGHVHQTPAHNNRLYSVGGRSLQDTSEGTVVIGSFE